MLAQEVHVQEMERKYGEEIKEMVEKTKFYDDTNLEIKKIKQDKTADVSLIDSDTSSAIFRYAGTGHAKVCALNFASFTNPGGGYMNGSMAQEEALCGDSCLYNVLYQFPEYYAYNREHRNGGLYENRALYTPQVIFKNENVKVRCDILTCASPNKDVAVLNASENKKAVKERIKFILNIIREEHPETVILGAFGCGAFGQNPKVVANYFYEMIDEYLPNDINVIFAIPKNRTGNYVAFAEAMEKYFKHNNNIG